MNIRNLILLFIIVNVVKLAIAQNATTLIDEDFNDISDWDDLSTAITWGGHTEATSALKVENGTCTIGNEATIDICDYKESQHLKTFTCLDKQFPPVDHRNQTLKIDFGARWTEGEMTSEQSRFVIFVNHDYPNSGLDLTLDDKYNKFDREWWARPAYNLRIRGGGTTLMMYGGGMDPKGEYEIYKNLWWLPGFSSSPGGGSPGASSAKGWVETLENLAFKEWNNYRYQITPTEQQIWFDANDNGEFEDNEIKAAQNIASDPDNPDFFNFFEELTGIRILWRGRNESQAELDWLKVTVTDNNVNVDETETSSPESFALMQNFPNPFNSSTTIRFSVKYEGMVKLSIYNVLGQEVTVLTDGWQESGNYSVVWDARCQHGISLQSGVYFMRLETNDRVFRRKLVYIR